MFKFASPDCRLTSLSILEGRHHL